MGSVWMEEVSGPVAWRGEDLQSDGSWMIHLTDAQLRDIDQALAAAKATGRPLAEIGPDQFPIGETKALLASVIDEIRHGRGFVVLRGLPVARYSDDDVGLIFWGLGRHLGTPLYQNPRGDLLGHVYDHGRKYGELDVRG